MTRSLRPHFFSRNALIIRLGLPAFVLLLGMFLWWLPRPLLAQGGCNVQGTPSFTDYYGAISLDGQSAAIGTLVEAFTPQGVRAGCFVVNASGFYGYMRVYGADANTGTPGMSPGQAVTFKINGMATVSNPAPIIWSGDLAQHQVDLSAVSTPTNTPTFTPVPPTFTPTFTPVPPTFTPTFTPVPPTFTPTLTPVPPTFTPTFTPTPPTSPGSKTKSFQNGVAPSASYSGVVDAYVSEAQSTTNFGTATPLIVSGSDPTGTGKDKWALLKWNLTTITGIVQSASLTLNITDHSGGQSYELYEAVATWGETTVKWSAKPARGTTLLGTVQATANGSLTANLNAAGVAVVQKWLNTSSKNYGFYLLHSANTDTMAFDSREKTTATLRPKLTVTYKPPQFINPPQVCGLTATTATVCWETDTFAKSKIKYRKQGTTTWITKSVSTVLASGKWRATANLTGLTANTTYEFQVQASADTTWTSSRTFRTLAASPAADEASVPPSDLLNPPSGYAVAIPATMQATDAGQISLPVFLTLGSGDVSGLAFTLALDPSQFSFDAADADEDGLPDAVSFNLPGDFSASVNWDPARGELTILLSDLNRESLADLDGALLSVSLTQVTAWQPGRAPMTFAVGAPPVLFDRAGNSHPVTVGGDQSVNSHSPHLFLPVVYK